jgi:hypothetical protein
MINLRFQLLGNQIVSLQTLDLDALLESRDSVGTLDFAHLFFPVGKKRGRLL